jgi:hypothetical protein
VPTRLQRFFCSNVAGAQPPNMAAKGSPRPVGEGLGEWVLKKAVQA